MHTHTPLRHRAAAKLLLCCCRRARSAMPALAPGALYDVPVTTIMGEQKPFGDFAKGKVALVVNTASACGLTPQYAGLEELYKSFGPRGFTVIGFPCNQCVFFLSFGVARQRRVRAHAASEGTSPRALSHALALSPPSHCSAPGLAGRRRATLRPKSPLRAPSTRPRFR